MNSVGALERGSGGTPSSSETVIFLPAVSRRGGVPNEDCGSGTVESVARVGVLFFEKALGDSSGAGCFVGLL